MLKIRLLNIPAQRLTSIFSQGMGFMFHPPGKSAKLFEFKQERQAGIHMLFVFFPLIVIWMNKTKKITHWAVMKPFTSFSSHRAKYVLEIPYNSEILSKLKPGNKLSWK